MKSNPNSSIPESLPALLPVTRAAALLGFSRKHLYHLIKSGRIPVARTANGDLRIALADLARLYRRRLQVQSGTLRPEPDKPCLAQPLIPEPPPSAQPPKLRMTGRFISRREFSQTGAAHVLAAMPLHPDILAEPGAPVANPLAASAHTA